MVAKTFNYLISFTYILCSKIEAQQWPAGGTGSAVALGPPSTPCNGADSQCGVRGGKTLPLLQLGGG